MKHFAYAFEETKSTSRKLFRDWRLEGFQHFHIHLCLESVVENISNSLIPTRQFLTILYKVLEKIGSYISDVRQNFSKCLVKKLIKKKLYFRFACLTSSGMLTMVTRSLSLPADSDSMNS